MTDGPSPTSHPRPLAVVVLAAGLGTRMKSDVPKVLHEVCGRPMLAYVLDAARTLGPERLVVVTGAEHEAVAEMLPEGCERAVQRERLGSGDALRAGMEPLAAFSGDVLVLVGDAPLADGEVLAAIMAAHRESGAAATVTTVELDDPARYGRIIRDEQGGVVRIVEARDASAEELAVREINVGFYVFDADDARRLLPRLRTDNVQGELYLTDLIELLLADGRRVAACRLPDPEAALAVNSRVELAAVEAIARRRILERLMLAGVTVTDPACTYVDAGVEVGRDTVLLPGTHLRGQTRVGAASLIGPDAFLENVEVGDRARVVTSHLYDCTVSSGCSVGPFAYLRPGTVLEDGAKAGTFVEIKNSHVGEASKVPHLSYVGDTEIGHDTNIGAGNITANYDGFRKHRTTIGDNVKTGSDTTFVAPVEVGDGAFTAAGSVITHDVPADALGVARSRQSNVEEYGRRRRERGASHDGPDRGPRSREHDGQG